MKERIENLKIGTMVRIIYLKTYAVCPTDKCCNMEFMIANKEYVRTRYEEKIYDEVFNSIKNRNPLPLICLKCNTCNFLRDFNEFTYSYTLTFALTI